jgi:DNA polymerase III alpha subunit (gram-positive type)
MPESDLSLGGFPMPHQRVLAFVDIETTGLPRRSPEGLECYGGIDVIDIAVIRDGVPWESKVRLSTFDEKRADVNAGRGRSWRDVTGYTAEEWAGAPSGAFVAHEFARQIHGCVFVAHNAPYDVGVASAFVERHGIPWTSIYSGSQIDTYPLAKAMLGRRGLTKFSLDACCEFLGLEREGYHRAMGGAQRCRQLFHELCKLAWRA